MVYTAKLKSRLRLERMRVADASNDQLCRDSGEKSGLVTAPLRLQLAATHNQPFHAWARLASSILMVQNDLALDRSGGGLWQ
jgi:hypothetical protein